MKINAWFVIGRRSILLLDSHGSSDTHFANNKHRTNTNQCKKEKKRKKTEPRN